jgi:gliding motility-associated-like protein
VKKLLFFFFLFSAALACATHNRAGEIIYRRIAPYTNVVGGVTVPVYTYSITIYTYTDHGPNVADRCSDTVYFGDGTRGFAPRINNDGSVQNCQGCTLCGEMLINDNDFKVKLNTYTITHTYPGAGTYLIQMIDPNRNVGVHNINHSDQYPFYLESLLVINNFSGANTSPEFKYPPTDRACIGKCFYHNPGAYDVDGDSLSFEITSSRGGDGQPIPVYFPPETGPNGQYSIDAVKGKLTWCVPQFIGQYNIAFIVREWRKNTSGVYKMIGYVLRDMQVIVGVCTNNPPEIKLPPDTCVEAGSYIKKDIRITDVLIIDSIPNRVTLSGHGGAFEATNPKGNLTNTFAQTPYTSEFTWQTTCDHIRQQAYQNVFKAEDQGQGLTLGLVNFNTYSIKVVPPSVKNVSATPQGSALKITWKLSTCSPASNRLTGYKIYRKNDCDPFVFDPCNVMIDPSSGFSLMGQTAANVDSLIDNNNGNGLVVGQNYSYLVVAVYQDGSQSFASTQVCAKLKRDIPVLLNVDVASTSATAGSVNVKWSRPLVNTGNLDTLVFTGPYNFILKYRLGSVGSFTPVHIFSSPYFMNLDTFYTHSGINTLDSTAYYEVEFTSGTTSVGSSPRASSIFLSAKPADRKINLSWKSQTPWSNYKYRIFRKNPGSGSFALIDSTAQTHYTDSSHVVNRYTYCYKVLGIGEYSDPTIAKPLLNNSEEVCATARDLTPPCSPVLTIDADCKKGFVNVTWNDVRTTCSDDVLKYVLYYKPTIEDPYEEVDTLSNNTTSYTYDGLTLISGCYAIQSVDSSGNASPMSIDFCIDNCPEFELPNIFSPNGDNANDAFKAIKVRQVKEISLVVFDRWGNEVYRSKDPYFEWNGVSLVTKKPVSEGTFFYFCEVFEPRLSGIRKRELKGFVQVVR